MQDDDDSVVASLAEAAQNVSRISRNVAYVASAVVSSTAGEPPSAASLSQYHRAMSDMLGYRQRMVASHIGEQTPRQVIQQSIARRLGGSERAPLVPPALLQDVPEPRTQHSLFQTFGVTAPAFSTDRTSNDYALSVRKEMAASELQEIDERINELRNMRKLVFDRMADVEFEQTTDERTLQHYYPRGELIRQFGGNSLSEPVIGVDFNSPFGQLAVATRNTVNCYELSSDRSMRLRGMGSRDINCIGVYGSDAVVACGAAHSVFLWQVGNSDGELCEPTEFAGHVGDVIVVDNDGDSLVTASLDQTVRLWDERQGRCASTIDMFEFGGCRALHHSGSGLAAGSSDGVVRLYDLRQPVISGSGRPNVARELLGGHTEPVTALSFAGLELVSGSSDGSMRLWDLRTGEISLAESYGSAIRSLQFDASKIVTSVAGESGVRVLSRPTDENRISASDDCEVTSAKYMKGYLVTGRANGSVGVWAV